MIRVMAQSFVYVGYVLLLVLITSGAVLFSGCDEGAEEMLAPYEGSRPLIFLEITSSYRPDIQWVGGRVAAVGINRGTQAALDSTLVWITTSDENTISSHVTVGQGTDAEAVRTFGGVPVDSLASGTEYTIWLAEQRALDAGLDPSLVDSFSFRDTTLTLEYLLRGRTGGDPNLDVDVTIVRNQTLLSDTYTITWAPDTLAVRQIGIRSSTVGGFTDLLWHVVLPDGAPDSIVPPVVIGEPPPGSTEVVEWAGFLTGTHTLWMTTSNWNGDFGLRAPGYVYFQIFSTNFD